MNKNISKLLQNILCSIISVVLIFGLLLGVANAEPVPVADPVQAVILQALDLTEDQRWDFIGKVLDKVTPSNYSSYVGTAKDILGLSISDSDMGKALKIYAEYPNTHKAALKNIIYLFKFRNDDQYRFSGYPDIMKRLNSDITGNPADNRGSKLFVEIFRIVKLFNASKPVFYNDAVDPYKVDIRIDEFNTLKEKLDYLILSIETFNNKGINSFDEFVAYLENEINTNSYSEIYNFKKYIKDEIGNSVYGSDIPDASGVDALQRIILSIVSLSEEKRTEFVDDILSKVNGSNYSEFVYPAKRILGASISDSDMTKALKAYALFPDTNKAKLNTYLKVAQLPEKYDGMEGFADIEKRLNYEIAGDAADTRGFKMFVEVFRLLTVFNGKAVFYNGEDDKYKIDIRIDGLNNLKSEFNVLVSSIESLKKRNITNFDEFVEYAETAVNTNAYGQIYQFKKFLKGELGNGSYSEAIPDPVNIDPMQRIILEIMSKPLGDRAEFVDNILLKITQSNYEEYLYPAKRILGAALSDSDVLNGLKAFAKYPDLHKKAFSTYLKNFQLPSGDYAGVETFPDIRKSINFEVAGSETDDRGLKLFVELFRAMMTFNTNALVYDDPDNEYKIDFRVEGNATLKDKINSLIVFIESLNRRGVTNIDEFITYAEDTVNKNTDIQIYYFKLFLKGELGNRVYSGNLPKPSDVDPLQSFILEAFELSQSDRISLVNGILGSVNSGNYADYVNAVKALIGNDMNNADIKEALRKFAALSDSNKEGLGTLIIQIKMPECYGKIEFPMVQVRINSRLAGSNSDCRGFRLFIKLFDAINAFNDAPVFSDDKSNPYKLDINITDNNSYVIDGKLDALISSLDSLKKYNVTDFESFVTYIEKEINSCTDEQIYKFKVFIKAELGNSAYKSEVPVPVMPTPTPVSTAVATPTATDVNVNTPKPSVSPTPVVTKEPDIDPLQKIILEILSLPRAKRIEFVDEVLAKLTSDNYADYLGKAKDILKISMSDADLLKALKTYAEYPATHKQTFCNYIKSFELPSGPYQNMDKFPDIRKSINREVAGDSNDDRGLKLFVEMLRAIRVINANSLIFDDPSDKYKIDINLQGSDFLKTKFNSLIVFIESLQKRGVTNFDEFISYAENIINSNPNKQIYEFKVFLKGELGNSSYSGTLPVPPEEPAATPTVKPAPESTKKNSSGGSSGSSNNNNDNNNDNDNGNGSNNGSTGENENGSTVNEPGNTVPNAPYDLVNHWAKTAVLNLMDKKIIEGYPDGSIRPDANVTRAEMAVIIVKALGLKPEANPDFAFADKKDIPDWAAGYIKVAVDKKILLGYEDNSFKPSKNLSREEMVVIVMKAFDVAAAEGKKLDFGDANQIGDWSKAYVAGAVEKGIVKGYTDNTFKPKNDVTRAEAFTVVEKNLK